MSIPEFRKKVFLVILTSATLVIFSNWASIAYQKQERAIEVITNTNMLKSHDEALKHKVNISENNTSHQVILDMVLKNQQALEEIIDDQQADRTFIIENIIAIKDQLIVLNNKK